MGQASGKTMGSKASSQASEMRSLELGYLGLATILVFANIVPVGEQEASLGFPESRDRYGWNPIRHQLTGIA